MAASKFKTLEEVLRHYQIKSQKVKFKEVPNVSASQGLRDDINFALEFVPYKVSEMAICENLIYPLLKAAWQPYVNSFTLWSHRSIEMDDNSVAYPDYVVSKNSEMGPLYFENPFLAVVEAKREDFTFGWAQCCSEMISLQKINSDKELPIYGIVSTGDLWQFAMLEQKTFTEFSNAFSINDLDGLLSCLTSIFENCKMRIG
jgi:hypothetical protein